MPTVQFTKEDFHENLGNGWKEGWDGYQFTYTKNVTPFARIIVLSSISQEGVARDTGEDSIRFSQEVLAEDGRWIYLKKDQEYTTRVPGWEERVEARIETITEKMERFKRTVPLHCESLPWVNFSKSAKNPGRPWCKCKKCGEWICWLDEEVVQEEIVEEAKPEPRVQEESEGEDIFSLLGSSSVPEPGKPIEYKPFVWQADGYGPNNEQLEIINSDPHRAIVVTAPPGSGKTFTTENLVVRLIQSGARPGSILYCTLSRDMAEEGAERIKAALKAQGVNLGHFELEEHERWWTTIHAVCNRMKAEHLGQRQDVIPEYMVKKFLIGDDRNKGIIQKYWNSNEEDSIPPWDEVYGLIQGAKTLGFIQGEDLEYFCSVCESNEIGLKLSKVRADFDHEMRYNTDRRNNPQPYTTFADMLLWVHSMLKNDPEFRSRWQGQFEFVINDEGQDTTRIQMEILSILAKTPDGNQSTVGDLNQMLFRFAGATPETNVGEGFEKAFPSSERKFLLVNYRSHSEIIDAANKLIEYNYDTKGGPNDSSLFEPMTSFRGPGGRIEYREWETPEEESMYILDKMKENNTPPGDVFVIARTRKQLAFTETYFLKSNIPYINRAGSGFWGSSHVGAAVGYLSLAIDPQDALAYKRCYNMKTRSMEKPRYLGKKFLDITNNSYQYLLDNRREIEKEWRFRGGVADLVGFVNDIKAKLDVDGFVDTLQYIIDECVYPHLVESKGEDSAGRYGEDEDDGAPKPLHDLILMKSIASSFETVHEFLEMVDKASAAAAASEDKSLWDDYAILSTVHRIKGQERPTVFVIGVSEGEKISTGAPVGLLPHTFAMTPPPSKFLYQPSQTRMEDERCIFYVAITRAKDNCYVSSSVIHPVFEDCVMRPSRFLQEAGLL